MMHVQWYQAGSGTLLQELAHSKSLYLIDECDSINISALYQKCSVHVLGVSEDEPLSADFPGYFTS